MKHIHHFLLVLTISLILPFGVFAQAPVVDESENYALLDDQQAAFEQPVDRSQSSVVNDERPFANEDIPVDKNSNAMLLNKLQGLQQELQELRGQLEVQAHELKQIKEQQLTFYKDLDARIGHQASTLGKNEAISSNNDNRTKLPTLLDNPKVTPQALPVNKAGRLKNPAEEQISYLAAYELVKNKQYDRALAAMNEFVAQYPQGGYSANAHYWLGELFMVTKKYNEAIIHFKIVLDQFPSSTKTAASMLKIGYALEALGKKQDAIYQLQQVVKNYPNSNTAQLAKVKLETINS